MNHNNNNCSNLFQVFVYLIHHIVTHRTRSQMSTYGNGERTQTPHILCSCRELRNMPLISFHSLSLSLSSSPASLMCRTRILSRALCILCALQINSIHSIILIKYKSKCSRNFSIFNHSSSNFTEHVSVRCVPVQCCEPNFDGEISHVSGILLLGCSAWHVGAVWAIHPSNDKYATARMDESACDSDVSRGNESHTAKVRKRVELVECMAAQRAWNNFSRGCACCTEPNHV